MTVGNWKKYKEEGSLSACDIGAIQCIASGIILTVGIVMVVCNITTMIACKTFPEKVVLDMITQYMKGQQHGGDDNISRNAAMEIDKRGGVDA